MNEFFTIKDRCRQGLIKYLEKACSKIPRLEDSRILDVGCGTGVPTIWMAENFAGKITAIDKEVDAINYLMRKINRMNLSKRIQPICTPFEDFDSDNEAFDRILAEGFLNVVDFEKGFNSLIALVRSKGFLIIHDEYKDHQRKLEFFHDNNCTLVDSLHLDEGIWWNNYYRQLETELNKIHDEGIKSLFRNEMEELRLYKVKPELFQSVYYVIEKE